MRIIYHFLLWLLTPLLPFYLKKRARRNPAYLQHWDERFGAPYEQAVKNAIWIHAVSVGEVNAVEEFVKRIYSLRNR